MCGGFVMHLSVQQHAWKKQIAYHAGRIFIYTFWGLFSGIFSKILLQYGENSTAQNSITIVAGSIMVIIALQNMHILPKGIISNKLMQNTFLIRVFRTFIQDKSYFSGFYLGLLTGFLPCALLWGFVAYSASKPYVLQSVMVMLVFVFSTILPLLLLGFLTTKLKNSTRTKLNYVSAFILLMLGIITILRGIPWIMMNFHYYVMKYGLMIHPE